MLRPKALQTLPQGGFREAVDRQPVAVPHDVVWDLLQAVCEGAAVDITYAKQGFEPVATPNERLFALEPDDIHMELKL